MRFVVSDEASQRLDAFAHSKILTLSRSSVQKLIEQGNILVNGNQEKTGYKLKVGDKIYICGEGLDVFTVESIQRNGNSIVTNAGWSEASKKCHNIDFGYVNIGIIKTIRRRIFKQS